MQKHKYQIIETNDKADFAEHIIKQRGFYHELLERITIALIPVLYPQGETPGGVVYEAEKIIHAMYPDIPVMWQDWLDLKNNK
jgi:hypothetical protein